MKTIIAIDSGANGGIAWKHPGKCAQCVSMPKTPSDVCSDLRVIILQAEHDGHPPVCYLEQLVKHMGPGIPASTMAVYASNWGTIQGAVIYAGVRLELIRPQEWQKFLGLGITGRHKADKNADAESKNKIRLLNGQLKRDWKNKLKDHAQRLFPHLANEITLNTADSLLLLEYGIRQNVL